jgi:alpha-tubulin suppressor-like RCC1 family protein
MLRNTFRFPALALVAFSIACSGDGGTDTPVAARLGMTTDLGETAQSGVLLSPQPVVQVLDASGNPVALRGQLVTASLANGGGTLGGTVGIRTDADGRAAFTDLIIAGPTGSKTLRFSAPGLSAAISRAVSLSAGPPTIASVNAGSSQTTAAGTAVPVAPSVKVTDGSSNPVVGVHVTFTVTGGGGSVTEAEPVTNAQGIATVGQWTLGTVAGQNALSATIEGLSTPLTFQATGVVGAPAHIIVLEGDGQTATILAAVPIAPVFKVTDAHDNAIQGLALVFTASNGGTAVGSAVSDVNGVARLGAWRLGFTPGPQTLTASRPDGPQTVLTATATDLQVISIGAGDAHSCGIGADHQARCWGDNAFGQLGGGGGVVTSDSVPVLVTAAGTFDSLATGGGHSCGLTSSGAAWCWGANNSGQVGSGGTGASAPPVSVSGGNTFKQISAGTVHTCALDLTGAAWCWGNGGNGRLGDGQASARSNPTRVTGSHVFTSISAGVAHTCGVRTDGVVLCWGSNANGRLGDGSLTERRVPTPVSGTGVFTAVAAGGNFTCAIDTQSAAWCWGGNASGQLGDGTTTQQAAPIAVAGSHAFTSITAGLAHSCALTAANAAFCWGEGANGRLGDGSSVDRKVPTAVFGTVTFSSIRAGTLHTCARTTGGSATCWGDNEAGKLGDGSTAGRATPTGVKRP